MFQLVYFTGQSKSEHSYRFLAMEIQELQKTILERTSIKWDFAVLAGKGAPPPPAMWPGDFFLTKRIERSFYQG